VPTGGLNAVATLKFTVVELDNSGSEGDVVELTEEGQFVSKTSFILVRTMIPAIYKTVDVFEKKFS
jgi:hypothetical protein